MIQENQCYLDGSKRLVEYEYISHLNTRYLDRDIVVDREVTRVTSRFFGLEKWAGKGFRERLVAHLARVRLPLPIMILD
jgi:hypothetical protein